MKISEGDSGECGRTIQTMRRAQSRAPGKGVIHAMTKKRQSLLAAFAVAFTLILTLARAQTPASAYPSLDSLRAAMLNQGASSNPVRRDAMLTALERLVLREPYDRDPAAVRHYRLMCESAIDEIAAQRGDTPGVRIWKFYSSGYVCRSGRTVFAFDLNQGVDSKRWIPDGHPGWTPPPKTDTDFVLSGCGEPEGKR